MDWQNLLFNMHGRIGQNDYWKGVAEVFLGNAALNILPLIGGLVWMVLVWVGFAVYGKRLHDTGRSAWYHAVPWAIILVINAIGFILIGGVLVAAVLSGSDIGPMLIIGAGGVGVFIYGFGNLVWLIYTIWLGMGEGQVGDNRFGPAPAIEMPAPPGDAA